MEREYELDGGANGEGSERRPQISGASTGVGFVRGGVSAEVRYISLKARIPQVSGASTAVALGRGGVPAEVRYITLDRAEETGS